MRATNTAYVLVHEVDGKKYGVRPYVSRKGDLGWLVRIPGLPDEWFPNVWGGSPTAALIAAVNYANMLDPDNDARAHLEGVDIL